MADSNGESTLQSEPATPTLPLVDDDRDMFDLSSDPTGEPSTDDNKDVSENPQDVSDDAIDLTPEDGDVLQPGDHLIELHTEKACPLQVLTLGLQQMGFAEVLLDQSSPSRFDLRFVGRLTRSIALKQTPHARWTYARRLRTDILSELRLKFKDYPLVQERVYETRFLSRMRSQPTRPMVEKELHEMGWDVLKLSALRRDMRIPSHNASVTLWFAVLRWMDVDSYVTNDDPFYFEDVISIADEA